MDLIFPLDTTKLNKGDIISPERCEEITGKKRFDKNFRLAVLKLKEQIIAASIDAGRPLSVACRGDGLIVHVDSEASEYHDNRSETGIRIMARGLAGLTKLVDRSRLTDKQQIDHDRCIAIRAMQVQSVHGAAKIAAEEFNAKQLAGEAVPGDAGSGLSG